MKISTILLLIGCLFQQGIFANCTAAYSSATYALSHTKRSMESDNFDHQKYYAGRAIEAFEKTRDLVTACGCDDALVPIQEGLINLNNAVDPADWDTGRFYVKKALAEARSLINIMDICTTQGTSQVSYDTASNTTDIPASDQPDYQVNNSSSAGNAGDSDLIAKQKQLEAEQQKLLAQQQELQKKIAEQKRKAEQARVQRELELEEQRKLQQLAESQIRELHRTLKNMAITLGCEEASRHIPAAPSRSPQVLEQENLNQTREYYMNSFIEIQQAAIKSLQNCHAAK
ncbi:hypothetical protein [Robertkochia aurantiaca]|uniref:hypothetical protein n=1 Tax=Robertkochia aurantiaca TaxID=2873700 RepID=UPI001CCFCE6F|nr:hypothetical protein [Robertkochia sp. 3YJGBD-33]